MTRKKTARVRRPVRPVLVFTYSMLDVMMASPSEPMALAKRTHQLSRMWQGLASIEHAERPTTMDWRLCSDAVNLLETLVCEGAGMSDDNGQHSRGWWLDCAGEWVRITDNSGLLMDGVTALALAGRRHFSTGTIRLDGPGIQAVRAVLEDYAALLEVLPARTVMLAHRQTEQRIWAIAHAQRRPHDIEVLDLADNT